MPDVPEQSPGEPNVPEAPEPDISDQALDSLLEDIQSEDPMNHEDEPTPVEEIEAELLPDPSKVTFGGNEVENRLTEKDAPIKQEEQAVGKELIDDVRSVIKLAKARFREDRLEAQEIIDYLKQVVMNSQSPSVGLVESLVSAMKVKTDATANITRIGDLASRALSAGKDHIDKKTSNDTDMEALYEALNTPEYGDEEDRKKRRRKNDEEDEPVENVVREERTEEQ